MKKVFTALLALVGFTMYANAATVDEVKPLEQNYVCVLGDYTNDGAGSRVADALFGDDYFLEASLNGGSVSSAKGSIDIADVSTYTAINGADVDYLSKTYAAYGSRLNSLRLKNAQDKIVFKPITGSKVYVFGMGNGKTGASARIPKFAKDAALEEALNEAPGDDHPQTSNYVYEFVIPEGFDGTVPMYIGSYNGDAFFSFIIVEVPVVAPKVAYLCGATETTEAIYTSLVNAGMEVTPLNYDEVSLTDADVETLAAYDLVVLAGNTGSGTNLAKTANLLVGKVNVLSTKSFWYKYYGTNGSNPGTADIPSLSLTKSIAGHPVFAGIEGDEFAVFNDMAKSSGRYLQSNGSFNETVGLTQVTLAQTNGADCIGEGWLNGKGYLIIPVDGIQPAGYLTAAGETLFANAAKYLIAGEQYVALDLTAYNQAVADAEAFKATLQSEEALKILDEETIQMCIEEIDLAIAYAQEGVDAAATQEDIDISANMLNETVGMYKANYDKQVMLAEAQRLTAVGDSIYNMYPEETRTDNAGLLNAMRALPFGRFWGTYEEGMALCKACEEAIPVFQKENNQAILDAAKKKANDYAATLDASEETGTMVQIEAYNGLTYMTSDEFFTESGISADSYDMVMSYSQQIDMMIAQYDPVIQKEKSMMAATKAAAAAQEYMASFEDATDYAGLASAIAKVNEILGELNMWDTMYTIEDLNAAVDALAAARVAFEKENTVGNGTYWLKNVASGKFITAGESWGTCAVFGEHGLDFDFILQEDGTFIIDSKLSNGGESHYFGAEGWMDAAATKWNIEKLPNGAYTITADGANFLGYDEANVWNAQTKVAVNMTDNAAEAAQWIILSKGKMVASLEGATEENPADATFFISCPNFGRNDTRFATAWQGGPARGGNNDNMAGEKWNTNFDVYQDLVGLPNGYYKLSAQGYYRAGNGGATGMDRNAYLYAGASKTPLVNINTEAGNVVFEGGNVSDVAGMGIVPNNMNTATTGFTAGLYADNSVVALVTDGTLRIGVKKDILIAADWTMFDNFELAYIGTGIPSAFAPAVDSLNAAIADANAWKATLDATNEMDAQVIAQIEQGMLPAAQAVVAQPASVAQIEEMIASVDMFVKQTAMTLGQMKAAEAQALMEQIKAENEDVLDVAGFEDAYTEIFNIANGMATGTYTWKDLNEAIDKMNAAKEIFELQEVPAPVSEIVNVMGKHRLVSLSCGEGLPVEIFYSYDEAMTEPAIYTAPFYVSETTTVYAYTQFIDEETRGRYTSDKVAFEIEAGEEVALNAPVIEKTTEGIVMSSDQSDVLGAPADTIEYAVYKKNVESGAYETAPYVSGSYTGAVAVDWASGDYKVVAKAVSFGYADAETSFEFEVRKVAYLCGATETTEAIYTALANSGLYVTPLNYDGVTLTDAAVDELAAEYDLVVLAGATGSGDALAKSANLLVGKVNVLSTKSFWYKHYGTNGDNPGTADAPSRSLVKTVADHPIFAGIEGDEFEVFNDMAKENGRYLQKNGSFNDAVGLTQTTLAQTNGADCIGEGWLNGYGYLIVPVDGAQPAGYLTAAGETLFANAAWYLIEGNQYAGSGSVTDNPFGIDVTTTEEIQWPADIYDIKGRMVKKEATSLEGLQSGLYLIKGQKVLVK